MRDRALVAFWASIVLSACGGGLSAGSTTSLSEVAANGALYGAMAAARAIPAPDERARQQRHAHRAEVVRYHYVCESADARRVRVRARSRDRAEAVCGAGCTCVDAIVADEVGLYAQPPPDAD